jgi:hypothetical protein
MLLTEPLCAAQADRQADHRRQGRRAPVLTVIYLGHRSRQFRRILLRQERGRRKGDNCSVERTECYTSACSSIGRIGSGPSGLGIDSKASSVEQVPSVMESPKATIAAAGVAGRTSIDLSQNMEVVLPVNALPSTEADWSPAPLSVR